LRDEGVPSRPLLRFGLFEADLDQRELRKDGRKVSLQEQPFQVLALLLERPGELVTREELQARLWPDGVFVDFEQGLNSAIKKLRAALGDSAESPRFVETLARRGYRFLGSVETVPHAFPAAPRETGDRKGRRLILAATGLAIVVGGLYGTLGRWSSTSGPVRPVMLVVLPFENLSQSPEEDYLSDGLTEEMIALMGRLHPGGLGVIGRASAMSYRNTRKRADEIGRDLGVDYLVSGSVRRTGARLRVTAELVRTRDQVQVWSASYDRELGDALDLQSELARAIVAEMPVRTAAAGSAPAARPQRVNPLAYESYLRGRYLLNRWTLEATREATASFERAVAEDPGYAPAWAFLGSALTVSAHMRGLAPKEAMARARPALSKAIALDPGLAEVHSHDGWLKLTYEWQFEAAAEAFRRALALNPSFANAREGLALYEAAMGRVEESVAEMRRARELDPLFVPASADLCLVLYYGRRFEEAGGECQKALEMDPGSLPAHLFLTRLLEAQGRHEEAIESRIQAVAVNSGRQPWFSHWRDQLRRVIRASGWEAAHRDLIAWMKGNLQNDPQLAYSIAEEYALLGDGAAALTWLEQAVDQRRYHLAFLKVEPRFDLLRGEPRFQSLLRRVGLPP
jgi:TolB-like protein/DNA-binding winged helix-turn-helix (wHTH) protein/Tfp pilus assembly protein PilF